jgi:hypothetical protein
MSKTNPNNDNLNRILQNNKKGLKKMKIAEGKGNELKSILQNFLKKIKPSTSILNNSPKMHLFKWNAIYFKNNEAYTKKYFEVYTSFLMLLSTIQQIKSFIEEHKDELSIDKEIRENIDIRSSIYPIENISNELENTQRQLGTMFQQTPDASYIFGKGNYEEVSKNTQKIFNKYSNKPGLLSFESFGGSSKQSIFQILVDKYISNRRLKEILKALISQYNLFKNKIIQTLKSENGDFAYGLLAFGFLFSFDYFTPLNSDDQMNLFTNKALYDLSTSNINVQDEIFKLNKGIFDIGRNMCSHINYFYNNGHKDISFYEVLHRAIDLDLEGLRFALYYVHPDYLNLFLQRKDKIDKQLYAYLSSYDMETEVPDFGELDIFSKFFEGEGLFLDFDKFRLL